MFANTRLTDKPMNDVLFQTCPCTLEKKIKIKKKRERGVVYRFLIYELNKIWELFK